MMGYGTHKTDFHRFIIVVTAHKSLDKSLETGFHQVVDKGMRLVFARKWGKRSQIARRLAIMIQIVNEFIAR